MMNKILFAFLIFSLLLIWSCNNAEREIAQPSDSETKKMVSYGDAIVYELVKTLKTAVKTTIDTAGPVAAISVCNIEAMPLTKKVKDEAPRDVSIKRTSYLFRNPANEPDDLESMALDHYMSLIETGEEIPPFYAQKIVEGEITYYNYYKPMKMENLCLLCHGDAATIPPNVQTKLHELYPNDKATGYKEGDFRGLIRVRFNKL